MKIKVQKSELKECIKNAVIRALNEQGLGYVNEMWDDEEDDDSDVLKAFLKDPKNKIKRQKGGNEARKAAMADIKAELDAEKKDDASVEAAEERDKAEN